MVSRNTSWFAVLIVAIVFPTTHPAQAQADSLIQNGSFETYAKAPGTW